MVRAQHILACGALRQTLHDAEAEAFAAMIAPCITAGSSGWLWMSSALSNSYLYSKILLAHQLHACDTFLAAAYAEFLQARHGVRVLLHRLYCTHVVFNIPSGTAKNVTLYVPFLISYTVLTKNVITNNVFKSASFLYMCTLHALKATIKSNFT